MIIFKNSDRRFEGSSYNEVYAADPDHFSHTATFEALHQVFDDHLPVSGPLRCLDLGCGQGQVLARVAEEIVTRLAADGSDLYQHLYGLDVSRVAIEQCETRYPGMRWIEDSFQDFLDRELAATEFPGTFDLIINKGGLTHVESETDYARMIDGIRRLLRQGGIYLFVKNKEFYRVWSNGYCRGWGQDIFDIVERSFEQTMDLSTRAYYVQLGQRTTERLVADVPPRAPVDKPVSIEFTQSDGSTREVFVSGDIRTVEQLEGLRRSPRTDPMWQLDLAESMSEGRRPPEPDMLKAIHKAFRPDLPSILIPGNRVRLQAGVRAPWQAEVAKALSGQANLLPYTTSCNNSRHYVRHVSEWLRLWPDVAVLGVAFEDALVDVLYDKVHVDPDETAFRLDWVFDLLCLQGIDVLWLDTDWPHAWEDERGRWRSDPDLAAAHREVACTTARAYGIPVASLWGQQPPPDTARSDRRQVRRVRAELVARLQAQISAMLANRQVSK